MQNVDMCIKLSRMWISCRQLYIQYTQIRGINFLLKYPLTYGKSGDIISLVDAVNASDNKVTNHDN